LFKNRLSKYIKGLALVCCLILSAIPGYGAITNMGSYLCYDNVNDITWMMDANHASTTGYPQSNLTNANLSGQMIWNSATVWAAQLDYGGYTDWRLPTAEEVQGYGAHGELGYLFYTDFGNSKNTNKLKSFVCGSITVSNVQSGGYWSSTQYTKYPENTWTFNFYNGSSDYVTADAGRWAWAVRDGEPELPVNQLTFNTLSVTFNGVAVTMGDT
jgi:hypothetical protein